jgi:hypothetical protein
VADDASLARGAGVSYRSRNSIIVEQKTTGIILRTRPLTETSLIVQ